MDLKEELEQLELQNEVRERRMRELRDMIERAQRELESVKNDHIFTHGQIVLLKEILEKKEED
jgi:cell division protein FtsB